MISAIKMRFIFIIAMVFTSVQAIAQTDWEQLGVDRFSVAIERNSPFLVSNHGRVLRMDAEGWKLSARTPGAALGIRLRGLRAVAVGIGFSMTSDDAGVNWITRADSHWHSWNLAWTSDDTLYSFSGKGDVLQSVDAGKSWRVVKSVDVSTIFAMDFADSRTGYLGMPLGIILRTKDAGSTWEELETGNTFEIGAIKCFGDTLIVASHGSQFAISTTQGDTWSRIKVQDGLSQVWSVSRSSSGTWVATGRGNSKRVALYSSNQGRDWQVAQAEASSTFTDILSSDFGSNEGLAVGSFGAIYSSSDDGQSWQSRASSGLQEPFGTSDVIYGISIGRSNRIYTASSESTIRASTDLGLTWQRYESTFTQVSFQHVHEYSADVLLACGYDNAFHRSTDAGITWQRNAMMPSLGYPRIRQKDKQLWMPGSKYILTSMDSGLTWQIIDSLPQSIKEIIILPDGRFAAVGEQGGSKGNSHFSLADVNGKNWSTTIFDSINGLFGLTYLSGDSLMASGRNGILLTSGDMGQTWTKSNTGHNAIMYKLVAVNDTLVVGASSDGILESHDRGRNWQKIELPNTIRQQDVDPNQTTVFDVAVATDGRVYVAGTQFIFVRGLKPDTSHRASILRRSTNPHLRIKPYPNPVTGSKAIASIWGIYTIRDVKRELGLYDLMGRRIIDLSEQINRDRNALVAEVEIDVRELAKGVYMLVLSAGGDTLSEPIVVY